MRSTHSTLGLLITATAALFLAASYSDAAPIYNRADQQQVDTLDKRWEVAYARPVAPPSPPSSMFLGRDGHAVFDDDDDDAGNEMLDTEEQLLRPDADDEIEGTIEGQVLEVDDDEEDDDLAGMDIVEDDDDPLTDAEIEAINRAFLDKDALAYYQQIQQPSPVPPVSVSTPPQEEYTRPVVMARFDGARTRSRALK
ncbi:hypothetical protein BGW41_004881 [Actinomortierella wolfii]|nr:hypothetical protein BGW41_004881 [Actinomortierella wolfii]